MGSPAYGTPQEEEEEPRCAIVYRSTLHGTMTHRPEDDIAKHSDVLSYAYWTIRCLNAAQHLNANAVSD